MNSSEWALQKGSTESRWCQRWRRRLFGGPLQTSEHQYLWSRRVGVAVPSLVEQWRQLEGSPRSEFHASDEKVLAESCGFSIHKRLLKNFLCVCGTYAGISKDPLDGRDKPLLLATDLPGT